MREKRKNNLTLKLLSLGLAFLIWLIVVNVSNPDIEMSVTVPIEVRNADVLTSADKTYSLDEKNVRISYKIRTQFRSRVSASDFSAYIDLEDYSITGAVPVYTSVLNGKNNLVGSVSASPMVVHVDTEDIQRKRFDLESGTFSAVTEGGAADGYAAGEIETETDYIYVQGPVSEVGKISRVGIEVRITEATENVSGEATPVFYDANGNVITDIDERFTLSRETIAYTVPIYKIKAMSITADVMGEPEEGYEFNEVECSPSFINVYGPDEILDEYNTINIPEYELDITGASQNITRSVDIAEYIPEGLSLAEPGSEITVVARIRRRPVVTVTTESTESADEGETAETAESESSSETSESAESVLQSSEAASEQSGPHMTESSSEGEQNSESSHGASGAGEAPSESRQDSGSTR